MNFTIIGPFFLTLVSLLRPSFCAVPCVRLASTSLETKFIESTRTLMRDQRPEDWFPTTHEGQESICDEILRTLNITHTVYDTVEILTITRVTNGHSSIPRRNLRCVWNGNDMRIFPVPKNSTVYVSAAVPLNNGPDREFRTLNYCFHLAPYPTLEPVLISFNSHSSYGTPNGYEDRRIDFATQNKPNPLTNLTLPERYVLCRLVFQSSFFLNMRTGISVAGTAGRPVIRYTNSRIFEQMTGSSTEHISFEDPRRPGMLPNRQFDPDTVIRCDSTNQTSYYVIFAYYQFSVYLMELVTRVTFPTVYGEQSNTSYPVFKPLTEISNIAIVDKVLNEVY